MSDLHPLAEEGTYIDFFPSLFFVFLIWSKRSWIWSLGTYGGYYREIPSSKGWGPHDDLIVIDDISKNGEGEKGRGGVRIAAIDLAEITMEISSAFVDVFGV